MNPKPIIKKTESIWGLKKGFFTFGMDDKSGSSGRDKWSRYEAEATTRNSLRIHRVFQDQTRKSLLLLLGI